MKITKQINMEEDRELKKELTYLLIEAKNDGHHLTGDQMIGYFFKGPKEDIYLIRLKEIANKFEEHWQVMSITFEDCIKDSGINLVPYYN